MKLSQIVIHHQDNHTDQLYEPLRKAIDTCYPQTLATILHHNPIHSDVRKSTLQFAPLQPNIIKETTLIPQNMRLVQTNNPLKRFKARSRSYRAISVQQRVGSPLNKEMMKDSIANKWSSKRQIVYDYEPGEYQQHIHNQNNIAAMTASGHYKLPTRSRSVTCLMPIFENLANRVERVQSKTITMSNKQSQHISHPSTKASIQIAEQPSHSNRAKRLSKYVNQQQFSDYYQDCKRYAFDKRIKKQIESSQSQGLELSPRGSYKYNLFSAMDEQVNNNCSGGLCTRNEVITPKIKQRW